MPIFTFHGRNTTGEAVSGKRMAQSQDALSVQLVKEGIIPINISSDDSKTDWQAIKDKLFAKPISQDEMSVFARQMYTLVKTGVPLGSALKNLAANMKNPTMRNTLYGIVEHLESGQDLANAMQSYSVFPPIVVSMVRVGQSSGNLAEAFLRINQYIEQEGSALKKLRTAMRYPAFVLVSVFTAMIVINIFVIPAFSNVFSQAKIELPLITRLFIGLSNFFVHYWILLSIAVVALGLAFFYYINTPQGRLKWDKLLLHIPIIGLMLQRIVLLRFAQSFAITINSGIPLIEGIELIAQSVNNTYASERILLMRGAIERGNNLAQAAAITELFTPLELQVLSVSEQTGELGEMLEQIAIYYRREVDYDLKRLSDIVEPLLILALAGFILMLALAVYVPIWNMAKLAHMN
ncbi:MAG: type II secretion system F family protein [Pseudomonadota bacterium]